MANLVVTVACVTLWSSLAPAHVPGVVDARLLPGYVLLQSHVALAGQPSMDGLARLRDLGFQTIVNLRTRAEGPAEERAIVEAQGLRYVTIPIGRRITPEAVLALEAVIEDPGAGAILIHCASGRRAGALWQALRRSRPSPQQ